MHLHFETRVNKPKVFHITESLIAAAKERCGCNVTTCLGTDLSDLSWLASTTGLITSNDVIRDPKFPISGLSQAAPNLTWIHIIGAGIEPLLPLDWLPPNVTLTNNSGVHFEKAAESATMVLLMLNSRLPAIVSNQHQAIWDQIFTPTVKGKTVLIIGVGDMGTAVASAARNLGLRVLGVRRSASSHEFVDEMFSIDELDSVLPRADFIVLCTPLTDETRNLMDRRRFQRVKFGAAFFNFGRAGSVDHDALIESLQEGRLSGAVIDVVEPEPLDGASPLWHTKNLIITPHVTSDDLEGYLPKTLDLVFENARRLQAAEPLLNCVDRKRGY
jgi:phosphoglycerate dehydrogenase-like enzyme